MTEGAAQTRATAARRRRIPEESGIFAVLVVVALVLSLISPSFRTVSNGFVLLVNGAVIMFLALGQSFVLLTGGIDLSTGANIAMTGVIAALLMKLGVPWPIASLLALSCATILGLINGGLTHFLRIPAFIATFSTQGVALAVPLIITGAQSISVHDFGFSWIGQGRVLGVPTPIILVAPDAVGGKNIPALEEAAQHAVDCGAGDRRGRHVRAETEKRSGRPREVRRSLAIEIGHEGQASSAGSGGQRQFVERLIGDAEHAAEGVSDFRRIERCDHRDEGACRVGVAVDRAGFVPNARRRTPVERATGAERDDGVAFAHVETQRGRHVVAGASANHRANKRSYSFADNASACIGGYDLGKLRRPLDPRGSEVRERELPSIVEGVEIAGSRCAAALRDGMTTEPVDHVVERKHDPRGLRD
jgi:hypothetical protein